ncbi:MAG: DUF5131 family protein [Planctomycetaceae bacterium]|nr:DUF5131 family protein [Planctomycetaceae bacterium]
MGELTLEGIGWVIVGGESGKRRSIRPMKPAWVESIQQQCAAAGVPFFFKQWGNWGGRCVWRSKAKNGRELNGRTYDEVPEWVRGPLRPRAERHALIDELRLKYAAFPREVLLSNSATARVQDFDITG